MLKRIIKRNGTVEDFTPHKVNMWSQWASSTLGDRVDWSRIVLDTMKQFGEEIQSQVLQKQLIKTCLEKRSWPYNLMAGKLYIALYRKELYGDNIPTVKNLQDSMFLNGLMRQMNYSEDEFETIESIIDHSRDFNLAHFQIHQIRKKYSLQDRINGTEFETPQFVYMRMAMALAEDEPMSVRMEHLKNWYNHLSFNRLNAPTPNYTNLGTTHNGYASCFPEGTKIDIPGGFKHIENIVPGDLVIGKSGLIRKVVGITNRHYNGRLVSLTSPIIFNNTSPSTADHRYYIRRNGKMQWISAIDIRDGDYLFHPMQPEINEPVTIWDVVSKTLEQHNYGLIGDVVGKINTCDNKGEFSQRINSIKNIQLKNNQGFYRLAGYYLAEGHSTIIESKKSGHIDFTFNSKDNEYVNDVVNLLNELFGVVAKIVDDSEKDGSIRITVHSWILATLFSELCGKGAELKGDKRNFFLTSDNDAIIQCVAGFLRGDGCAWKTGYVGDSISHNLICFIRDAALKLHYQTSVSAKNRNPNDGYGNAKPIYTVRITMQPDDKLALAVNKDLYKIQHRNALFNYTDFDTNGAYSRVMNMKISSFTGVVYDFEVETDHSFTVDGVCVHNCCLYTVADNAQSLAIGDHIAYTMTYMSAGIGGFINTRSLNDPVRNGAIIHQGKVPYFRSLAGAVKANLQGGRGGACTTYFTCYDPEVMTIIMLQNPRSTKDKQNRDIHFAMMSNRFFAVKAAKNEDIFTFNTHTAPDLQDAFFSGNADEFENLYRLYEGNPRFEKNYVSARKILTAYGQQSFDVATLYHFLVDEANRHTPFKDKIYSSNLCVEISEPTAPYHDMRDLYSNDDISFISFKNQFGALIEIKGNIPVTTQRGVISAYDLVVGDEVLNCEVTEIIERKASSEVALCSLAAIVEPNIKSDEEYASVSYYALKMIDKCIHLSDYALPHVGFTAKQRLNAGVGMLGVATRLAKLGLKYDTVESRQKMHQMAERHAYFLIKASLQLGKELGNAPWIHKTKWPEGWLPLDTYKRAVDELASPEYKYDWEVLRSDVISNGGIRNSTLIAHMPSESSSKASGAANSLYPTRDTSIKKTDAHNVIDWCAVDDDIYGDQYQSAWHISSVDMVKAYAIFQKFTDQSISADLYRDRTINMNITTEEMIETHLTMVKYGLKSRYYQNSLTSAQEKPKEENEHEDTIIPNEKAECVGGCTL